MKPRILLAGFFHETHSFVDGVTTWDDFTITCGEAILRKEGDRSPTAGFLAEARRLDFEIIPTIDMRATPSGVVTDATLERFWQEFSERACGPLAEGVDGIFLVLHGAMITESLDDPEGEFLDRLRLLPGAATVPIFGTLDLHANVTGRMCRAANALVMYKENPHTDAEATAQLATRLLGRCLRDKKVPRMAWCRPPIIWPPSGTGTATDPMLALKQHALRIEADHPDIWAFNVAGGFSFADCREAGVSLSLTGTAPPEEMRRHLQVAGDLAWSLRERGVEKHPGVNEVVARLEANPPKTGPVLLVEPSDNVGGGAPGDGTGVLRALSRSSLRKCLVILNDPATVRVFADDKLGTKRTLKVGGRGSRLDEGPLELELELVSRSDGEFDLEDPHSHLASMTGRHFSMGPCAVVRSRNVTLLLTSQRTPPLDLGQLRSQGIEPRDFEVIGVKAAVAHRQAYNPIASASFSVYTPGPCSSNLAALPWRKLRRPVFPLDSISTPEFLFD